MKNKLILVLSCLPLLALGQNIISQYSPTKRGLEKNQNFDNSIDLARNIRTTLINDIKIQNSSSNFYLSTSLTLTQSSRNNKTIKVLNNYHISKSILKIRRTKDVQEEVKKVLDLNPTLDYN